MITIHQQQQHQQQQSQPATATTTTANNEEDDSDDTNNILAALGDYDVLCGRHKAAFNNTGNRRFRITVSLSLACFMKASSRKEKNTVIKSILKIVQGNGGRFLEYDKKSANFVELTTRKAHMKVGHALRDMALASRKDVTVTVVSEGNDNLSGPTIQIVSTAAEDTAASTTFNNNPTGTTTTWNSATGEEEEQPVVEGDDPWDRLESNPVTDVAGIGTATPTRTMDHHELNCNVDDDESSPPFLHEDHDIDMLQWLVGESNGLLQDHFDRHPVVEPPPAEIITATTAAPAQQEQPQFLDDEDRLRWPSNSGSILVGGHHERQQQQQQQTMTTIEPIPLIVANHNNDNNNSDNNREVQSLRESFVMDRTLLEWLVGENNDLVAEERFEMV